MPPKDHRDVVVFLGLFNQLKERINGDYANLERVAQTDEEVRDLCEKVHSASWPFTSVYNKDRDLFSSPVDPFFTFAWREYEDHYAGPLAGVDLFITLGFGPDEFKKSTLSDFEFKLQSATEEANEDIRQIRALLIFAESASDSYEIDGDLLEDIESGLEKIKLYANTYGPKIGRVLRRRRLVPFVNIPRHVAKKHGSAEKLSLYKHLREAQEAFIYGLPLAALSLMRSLLEILLRLHYEAGEGDLLEMIDQVKNLPDKVSKSRLHILRKLSNDILHFNTDRDLIPPDDKLEKEIIQYLLILRTMIEGAPTRAS